MRGDGSFTPSSTTLHLDPRQARSAINHELDIAMGDDAAIYLCIVLQHVIERLVAGALSSCDKPELRTKYGGTGKDVHPGTDMQPRHLQDYIRTNKEMWSLFNSSFSFQVVLSVFLDHPTETVFQRLGLPIHDKGALAACDSYLTVIGELQQKRSSQVSYRTKTTSTGDLPPVPPSVTSSAQLARVAAGVNPLCSMSPKASLMADALVHELCMAVCEDVMRSEPNIRVVTMVDLDGGIRGVFPEALATEMTREGKEALSAMWTEPEPPLAAGGESTHDHLRLCVRQLQGTHTLLRKTFRVSPGTLLFTVFSKACERLRVREVTVVFVHDGMLLSGRRQAGTLTRGVAAARPSVNIFAVCKRAWACKQRAAARRGLLTGGNSRFPKQRESTREQPQLAADDSQRSKEKAEQQLNLPPRLAPNAKRVARATTGARATPEALHKARSEPLLTTTVPSRRTLPSLPAAQKTYQSGEGMLRRTRKRWIATPAKGAKIDLGRLEEAPIPIPSGRLAGRSFAAAFGSGSTGLLVDSDGAAVTSDRGGGGGEGVGGVPGGGVAIVTSPRMKRTMRRLGAVEDCLRELQDSMRELQLGDLAGRPSGISSVAMAAITSQLDVACNLSSLCRQVLPHADDDVSQSEEPECDNQANKARTRRSLSGTRSRHAHVIDRDPVQLPGEGIREKRVSFLTEVPNVPQDALGSQDFRTQASGRESAVRAAMRPDCPLDTGANRTVEGGNCLLDQRPANKTLHKDEGDTNVRTKENARALGISRDGQQRDGARKQRTSSCSNHDHRLLSSWSPTTSPAAASTSSVEDIPPSSRRSAAYAKQPGDANEAKHERLYAAAATAVAAAEEGSSTWGQHLAEVEPKTPPETHEPQEARSSLGDIGCVTGITDQGPNARLARGIVAQPEDAPVAGRRMEVRRHLLVGGSDVCVPAKPDGAGGEEGGRAVALITTPRQEPERVQSPDHSWADRERAEKRGQGGGSGRNTGVEKRMRAGANGGKEGHGGNEWCKESREKSKPPRQGLSSSAQETVDTGQDHHPDHGSHGNDGKSGSANKGGKLPSCGQTTDALVLEPLWSASVATGTARYDNDALHHEPVPFDQAKLATPTGSAVAPGRGLDMHEHDMHESEHRAMKAGRGTTLPRSLTCTQQDNYSTSAGKVVATAKELISERGTDIRHTTSDRSEPGASYTRDSLDVEPLQGGPDPEPQARPEPKYEPEHEPESDRCGDEVWDDEGDGDVGGEDFDGNWSTWLRAGG